MTKKEVDTYIKLHNKIKTEAEGCWKDYSGIVYGRDLKHYKFKNIITSNTEGYIIFENRMNKQQFDELPLSYLTLSQVKRDKLLKKESDLRFAKEAVGKTINRLYKKGIAL